MDYLPEVITTAQKAGEILLSHFHSGFKHSITTKPDKSPVTQADIAANKIIVEHLTKIDPNIPILSEENDIPNFSIRQTWQRYWLVDPLDGTRGFIRRSSEFCVNIALIENHEPILGVIYSPVDKMCYYAMKGGDAFSLSSKTNVIQKLAVSKNNKNTLRFLTGHFDKTFQLSERKKSLEKSFGNVTITQMNSAIKFAVIASGSADVYVRFGPTSEWDTAAGQCILEAAGGAVVDFNGQPLQYNAKSSLINPSFIVMGDRSRSEEYINSIRKIA